MWPDSLKRSDAQVFRFSEICWDVFFFFLPLKKKRNPIEKDVVLMFINSIHQSANLFMMAIMRHHKQRKHKIHLTVSVT